MNPDQLLDRLRDIRGLDPIGPWPPGPGWWLVAVLALAIVIALYWLLRQSRWRGPRLVRRQRWQRQAADELHQLRRRLHAQDGKSIAGELGELLRRMAIARHGRAQCAALCGDDWLIWLSRHDPEGYDWQRYGRLLLSLAYSPAGGEEHRPELDELLNAALGWTRSTETAGV